MLKKIFYAVLLGAGMAACLSQQAEDEETATATESPMLPGPTEEAVAQPDPALFVVGKQRVGNIQIGMPIKQMREQIAPGLSIKDTTLNLEGTQSTAYVLRPEDQPKGILVEQACEENCHVWRISVLNPDFKTAKGIGIGSKYGELQQAYNIQSVTFEEGNLVALSPGSGMSFILEHNSLPSDQLTRLDASTVPANLLIKKILVY
ncbi:mechanosensitive ion channel protein MscS [Pontibacter kalidii]|uniref:mechanosensitive ion channel protein MscS n=1 Tax=Pontibacter kalidii TaxID=2592049 RepID=UPI002254CFBE|nr:mechanosensitive ion channel protein MscS [Pontibacter kalidii]